MLYSCKRFVDKIVQEKKSFSEKIDILIIYNIIILKSVCLSVGVRKLQFAILARSSREMSLTVHIV